MNIIHPIQTIIQNKNMLTHPFYQDWMKGDLSLEQLQNYSIQYKPFVDAFPRFVSAAHSLCEIPEHREMLMDNLMDEEGKSYSDSHPKLWDDFIAGLQANPETFALQPYALELRDCFLGLTRKSYSSALAALYAYESQIPEIAKLKIEGLQQNYGMDQEKTLQFFRVHQKADVYHREACEKMLQDLPSGQESVESAQVATQALWNFLTHAHESKSF